MTSLLRAIRIAIHKIITRIAISMEAIAAGQREKASLADLNTIFAQQIKFYRVAPAHARSLRRDVCAFYVCFLIQFHLNQYRMQGTRQTKRAKGLVTLPNGLAMAIAMTQITHVDAIGTVAIAAVPTGISNSARTACAEIQIIKNQSNRMLSVLFVVNGHRHLMNAGYI